MTLVGADFAIGRALTGYNSNDGTSGTNVLVCIEDGNKSTNCAKIGQNNDDCYKITIPGLLDAAPGDTIKVWVNMGMNFETMACIPYKAATAVEVANRLTGATSSSPITFTLTQAWIDDVWETPAGAGRFRLVEDLALPISGDIECSEVEVDLTELSGGFVSAVAGAATVGAGLEAVARTSAAVAGAATVGAGIQATIRTSAAVTGAATIGAGIQATIRTTAAVAGLATITAGISDVSSVKFAAAIAGAATVTAGIADVSSLKFDSAIAGLATVGVGLEATARTSAGVAGAATIGVRLKAFGRVSAAVAGSATVGAGLEAIARTSSAIAGLATIGAAISDIGVIATFPGAAILEFAAPIVLLSGPADEILQTDTWLRRTVEADGELGQTKDGDGWIRRTVASDTER